MKKHLKAILSVFLCAALMLGFVPAAFAGAEDDLTSHDPHPLKFNEDGKFRILQLADTQDNIFLRYGTIYHIETAIDKYKPDLVVFTGDNTGAVNTAFECKYALKALLTCVENKGVPFTCVLGNHDAEHVSGETHLRNWRKYDGCLAYDADPSTYGTGNHNLPILDSKGEKTAFNLWMIDSNMYDSENGGYDYIHPDQFEWYKKTSDALKAENGGELVPSMCFQHIIPKEIEDYKVESDVDTGEGYYDGDKYIILDPDHAEPGSQMLESPCPGTVHSHQLEQFQRQGDVIAVFTGHDHVNDFVVHTEYTCASGKAIDISTTPTAGFCSYGDEINRGVRIIDIDENDPWSYETETPTFFDTCGDTEQMHALSYFSKPGAVYWYLGYFIRLVPFVGEMLRDAFLRTVWNIVKSRG